MNILTKIKWWLTVNDVSTENPESYPELKPLVTSGDTNEIIKAIEAGFERKGDRWKIIDIDRENHIIEAEINSKWLGFTDDITIRIESGSKNDDQTTVHIRSCSRIGRGDFGKNAQNIRDIQALLIEKLNP